MQPTERNGPCDSERGPAPGRPLNADRLSRGVGQVNHKLYATCGKYGHQQ